MRCIYQPVLTILVPILALGTDPPAQHLQVFATSATVQLVQPHILAARLVPQPGVVLHVRPEVRVLLQRGL